ncbi:MAG TPA: Hsp20/alpha crystallin family protein [Kofleriaceae bacterium]|nr:Hsp20/alpha crystallin family protein [Kofleriaceae bacterium]
MANITRGGNGGAVGSRDPFAFARELFSWDPFFRLDWPARTLVSQGPAAYAPAFNVVEKPEGYFITADLPGVAEEDLDVTVHDNHLIVSGSRKSEERKEGENYFVYERRAGNFSRAFALPETADASSVEAALRNGVLEVKVAKRESAKPRKVPLGQRIKDKLTGSAE